MDAKTIIGVIIAAVSVFIAAVLGRKSGHNESGISAAIDGEGELQNGIGKAESGEREHQAGIADLEGRVNETGAGISNLEAGIADTDRLADELKKRNNLG